MAAVGSDPSALPLHCGIAVRVEEGACEVVRDGLVASVGFARGFPSPRIERVSPGNLVAVATAPDGAQAVVWRWFDAVVLGSQDGHLRMWEPAHGEVEARSRGGQPRRTGTRVYLSAGLPGADWWAAGAVADEAEDADVELDEVQQLYTEHGLWSGVF